MKYDQKKYDQKTNSDLQNIKQKQSWTHVLEKG
jgi:hypothetical protein